jgi:hypothetical protein
MNPDTWEIEYNEVWLNCRPTRTADGRYAPNLVVSYRKVTPARELAVPLDDAGVYDSEQDAAHAAAAHGKRWADLNRGWSGT